MVFSLIGNLFIHSYYVEVRLINKSITYKLNNMRQTDSISPVDEIPPLGQLTVLGLQHVLVMYAGAVAVPLIIGRALGLDSHEVSLLVA